MPLVDIELSINGSDLPSDVRDFLREAYLRVGQFVRNSPIRVNGFAPSGFATVYRFLRTIVEARLAPGNSFCEWGSGFGVAASLARADWQEAHYIARHRGRAGVLPVRRRGDKSRATWQAVRVDRRERYRRALLRFPGDQPRTDLPEK